MPLVRNTFEGGLDYDSSHNFISPNKYIEAFNVSLVEEGEYGALVPMTGSQKLGEIIDFTNEYSASTVFNTDVNIMGAYSARMRDGSQFKEGGVVFIARSVGSLGSGNYTFEIWGITVGSGGMTPTILYSEDTTSDAMSATVDAVVSGDNGIDIIYFTDQINPMRKVRCVVDEGSFNSSELTLQRKGIVVPPGGNTYTDGGNLVSGSYQFCYRLINEANNSYTKWSLLTKPENVHTNTTDFVRGEGGLGHYSDQKATFTISIPSDLQGDYSHYQLGVVKNITGTGIPKLTGFIVEPKEIPSNSFTAEYVGDESEEEVSISEFTVEDAAIDSVGTLTVKDNRLIAGNIQYSDLQYDRGEVTVGNGTTNQFVDLGGENDITLSGKHSLGGRTYWRDEVYRLYISYYDDFGNFAKPQVLDFSSVSANRASSGVKDWKFPKRRHSDGKLFNNPSTNRPHGLRLRIEDITNHPTWAKGFVILQAKRKKNIMFQTPLIPTMSVQPALATGEYPQTGTPATPDAQPPNPLGTLMPKNFRHMLPKHIVRTATDFCYYFYDYPDEISYSGGQKSVPPQAAPYVHMVFPPNNMYNTGGTTYEPYTHNKSDRISFVDMVLTHRYYQKFDGDPTPGGYDNLDYPENQLATTAVALTSSWYWTTYSGSSISGDFDFVPNRARVMEYGEIAATDDQYTITSPVPGLESKTFGDYVGLAPTGGLSEGTIPGQQKGAVIVTDQPIIDPTYKSFTSTTSRSTLVDNDIQWLSGVLNIPTTFLDSSGPTFMTDNSEVNYNRAPGVFHIVNVVRGLDDSRYGGDNDFHELYHAATKTLTPSQVSNNTPVNVTVSAGDAFVTQHTFKVSDGTYSLPSGSSGSSQEDQWGHTFDNGLGAEIQRPIPISGHGQYISVILESEVDSSFQDRINNLDEVNADSVGLDQTDQYFPAPTGIGDIKTAFNYDYNIDYSIPNSTKVFAPPVALDNTNTEYKSRLVYSDARIYQTREVGFDRFRALNFYDLEESKGAITRLVNSQDNVYAIQEGAVAYVPILANVLETQDAGTLAVRSSEVISTPRYVTTRSGSKAVRSITLAPDGFFYADTDNRDIVRVSGFEAQNVSQLGAGSFFDDKLSRYSSTDVGGIPYYNLSGYYDLDRKEYILASQYDLQNAPYIIVFNESVGAWTSQIRTDSFADLFGGFYSPSGMIMVGRFSSNDLNVYRLYNDPNKGILGEDSAATVTFIANPEGPVSKVFDVYTIESSDQLATLNAGYSDITIDSTMRREGTDRVTSTRTEGNQRIRGQFNQVILAWNLQDYSRLNSVVTQYRLSERRI